MGYNSSDILELIDEEMTLLDILEFHQDLVINKQYECCCLINKLKKMIEEVRKRPMEYTIKEVTKKYNLSASTLRYYEKEGLLPKIKRIKAIKEFMMMMIPSWLDIIMCMRKTGMTIAYIKNYIELCQEGDNTINQRYEIFETERNIIIAATRVGKEY
ncbi:MAG: MerR family transcriptional regulator [Thomasclavelia ramosa]